jgi:hypothetical protein
MPRFQSPGALARGLGLAALLLAGSGCGPDVTTTELPEGEQNLRYLAMAYMQAATNLGRSPRDLDEIKPVLKDFGDPEKLSRSPRDGQPYVIVGGVPLRQGTPILAYEQTGQDGRRQVVDLRMVVREVTPEEFASLQFPPNHQPPSGS